MSPKRGLPQSELRHHAGEIYRAGFYYGFTSHAGNQVPLDGEILTMPVHITAPVTFDRIVANIQTAGASSVIRLGIYKVQPQGSTFADLILDAGTADSSTTGDKEITISQGLVPGVYVFIAVPQGGTVPALRANLFAQGPLVQTSIFQTSPGLSGSSSAIRPWSFGTFTGALPSTLSTPGSAAKNIVWVAVRAA